LKDVFMLQLSKTTERGDKNRPVKRLNGTGVVTTGRGREIPVEYHLCFPQDNPAAPPKDPSNVSVKEFSGQVWCPYDGSFVSVHSGKILTLRLEDGRQLRFFHQNRDGGIAVIEWLG
jgi:hypothetical protein